MIYAEYVDVVSAFDGLFGSDTLAPTVRHFERFPRLPQDDGEILTPDFTIVFQDGTGLVGEITRLALRDESLDSVARQVQNYDCITALPVEGGGLVDVSSADVLLLLPVQVAVQGFTRLQEAAADPNHFYSPSRPPCLVHYSLADNKYVFVRHAHPANGQLSEGDRPKDVDGNPIAIGSWMERSSVNVPDRLFVPAKVRNAFMNDPIDPLYLATHLWQREFAEIAGAARGGTRVRVEVSEAETAQDMRGRYGTGRKSDVTRAMQLLERAGLAERIDPSDRWAVGFYQLARSSSDDVHVAIAKRACSRRRPSVLEQMRQAEAPAPVKRRSNQGSLLYPYDAE